MLNILIMAGGRGERFWPKSRMDNPKQLLNLTGTDSMIRETVRRVAELTAPANIFIATNELYAAAIKDQLPEIPAGNFILEPEGRNTAPCIGLASLFIEALDPAGVTAVLASDHIIKDSAEFRRVLRKGAAVAEETGGIVTLGIKPDRAETGYGYIKLGRACEGETGVYRVERFTEKPNLETAAEFWQSGRYLWNSGMFIWKTAVIRRLITEFLPDMSLGLAKIKSCLHSAAYQQVLTEEFSKFEKISIDYGIMERAPEVFVIPAEIGWDDVGSWTSLERVRQADPNGNIFPDDNIVAVDVSDCIFETAGTRLVAAIGLRELIYVETSDAVLICPKNRSQDIRKVLAEIRRRGKEKYL